MDINSIEFDKFIEEFYSNNHNNKMVLQIDIENSNESSDTNIYDIHVMLLDLLIKGFERLNTLENLIQSIDYLQKYLITHYKNLELKSDEYFSNFLFKNKY